MDRIWQWAWDRYGARYSWAALAVAFPLSLPVYLFWYELKGKSAAMQVFGLNPAA
jgi:hypothetical protein